MVCSFGYYSLFYVVFGESSLNDAVALVLFNTFSHLLREQMEFSFWSVVQFLLDFLLQAVGSPTLGICFGALAALLFKTVDFRKHEFRMLELSLYLVCMYLPFILAEILNLSGIVSIFFAGISVRRYACPNVSQETSKAGESIFKVVAFLAETCIFIELGLSIFGFSGSFHWKFCFWALFACLFGRAAAIYPLAYVHNWSLRQWPVEDTDAKEESLTREESDDISVGTGFGSTTKKQIKRRRTPVHRKDKKISKGMAHILWFAGLRGAVAYACVHDFPDIYGHDDEFVAATMFIILFTVVIMGGGTEYLLEYLGIEMGVDEEDYMCNWLKEHELKGTFHDLGEFGIVLRHGCSSWRVEPRIVILMHFFFMWTPEEAYIHQLVTRSDAKIIIRPPFSFDDEADDDNKPVVSVELVGKPAQEEKQDPFSYQPATDK